MCQGMGTGGICRRVGGHMPARALLAGSVAALAAAGAAPAAAQQQAGIAAAGADIIVTARKREESLQSVPLAIAAFSAEAIEREGFRSIEDIALQSPGISFRQGFGRDADRPVIRGMSNIQGAANVGFFIDGVFVTGSVASLNLDNLERVEIIRGPQAALFGRNTFAGAVNFITRKPGNDLSAQARGSIGEDGLREISSFLSGPLIRDRLFAQIDGRYYEFGGQYENAADPEDRLGRQKSLSIGGTLLARPVDNFEVIGRAYYIRDKDGFYPIMRVNRVIGQSLPVPRQLVINNNSVNCFLPELTGQFNPAQRPVTATRSRGYHCGPLGLPDQFAVNSAEFRAAGFPDNLEREEWRASLTLRLDLNDWEFVAIGAYNDRKRRSATDQDYSDVRAPFPVPGAFETIDQGGTRDWSGEFRLLSPQSGRLRGLAGVYVYDERTRDDAFTANLNLGFNRAFQVGDDPARIVRNPVFTGKVRNWALFGQLAFDLTETLSLSAEGRYQQDRLSVAGESRATVGGQPFVRAITPDVTFRNFLPRFTVDWQARPDLLVYGVAAKGNKPGGFNTGVFNAFYGDSEVAQLVSQGLDTFKEEEAWSYEIGAKTQWLDQRLTLNVAAFFIDWNNQQLTQSVQIPRRDGALGSVSFTTNVGKSEVKGVEIEASARPTSWLSVRLGYALTDARIRDFLSDDQADLFITAEDLARLEAVAPLPTYQAPGSPGYPAYLAALAAAAPARTAAVNELIALRGNAAGNQLPRVPRHQFSTGAQVDVPLGSEVRGLLGANLALESRRFAQVHNLVYSPDMVLVNLRGGIEWKGLSLVGFVTNAFNNRTPVDILRYIDPQQTLLRPALRPGEATAQVGGRNLSSTNLRDFAVSAPRLRNFGMTAIYRF